uniref:C-type lectin domain-containing protein n=1 Tax=Cyprinus carpio TaxID=7962 RepID=A0A8C1GUG3_CYPCA
MDKGSIFDSEDRTEKIVDIYVTAEAVRDMKYRKDKEDLDNKTQKTQTPQHTAELVLFTDGWTYYQSSIYYMSKEMMNWTESRRYCMDTGADLIIINNTEKQEFVKNMSGGAAVWIGVTDSDVEGTWKWVDGRNVTSDGGIKEPNGATTENCAVTVGVPQSVFCELVGWIDVACNRAFQWICEKRISQFILP